MFINQGNMEISAKTLLLKMVDKFCLSEIQNRYTGYLGVVTMDLIYHLMNQYGKITPNDINNNKDCIEGAIDTSQPIDV